MTPVDKMTNDFRECEISSLIPTEMGDDEESSGTVSLHLCSRGTFAASGAFGARGIQGQLFQQQICGRTQAMNLLTTHVDRNTRAIIRHSDNTSAVFLGVNVYAGRCDPDVT